ncbi:Uncharacterized protein FKW44_010805 [Caligus rogercresseyi]|uniref:C2H2-type domain-containing protein n=1 Tax=Caligus rogercresseyi TaxID=217165 RepID=A0A7T8HH39_CALRO|nr:Uncharacterized protein FKW44_010805 [Caligus rogercresseyi]
MSTNSDNHFDPQICQDSALSSMMIVVKTEDGEDRFDCSECFKRYRHHPSLFRHFKTAHPEKYQLKVALRNEIRAQQRKAKRLGLPYLKMKNEKRNFRAKKKHKSSSNEDIEKKQEGDESDSSEAPSPKNIVQEIELEVEFSIPSEEDLYSLYSNSPASVEEYLESELGSPASSSETESIESHQALEPSVLNECQIETTEEDLSQAKDSQKNDPESKLECPLCKHIIQGNDGISNHLLLNHFDYWSEITNILEIDTGDTLEKNVEPKLEVVEDPVYTNIIFSCETCAQVYGSIKSIERHICFPQEISE